MLRRSAGSLLSVKADKAVAFRRLRDPKIERLLQQVGVYSARK